MCVMGLPCAQGLPHLTLPFTYPLFFLAPQISLEEEILFLNPWLCTRSTPFSFKEAAHSTTSSSEVLFHPHFHPSCNPASVL